MEVEQYSKARRLMELLRQMPQSSWLLPLDDDEKDWSLLHYAAMGNNVDAIKALVAAGADLENVSNEKQTPLQVAMDFRAVESMEALIKAGANMNVGHNNLMDSLVRQVGLRRFFGSSEGVLLMCPKLQPTTRLLFRHGLRVKPVVYFFSNQDPPPQVMVHKRTGPPPQEMVQWQDEWLKSVTRCRSTTIALLSVKRAAKQVRLAVWDKYLLAYMARHVWALRFVWPCDK